MGIFALMSEPNLFTYRYEPTPPPSPYESPIRLNCSQEALAAPPPTPAGLRLSQELLKAQETPLRKSQELRKSPLRISAEDLFPSVVQPKESFEERFKRLGRIASHKNPPPESACPESTCPSAKGRNRYPQDIYPTSLGLVKLLHSEHYINANHFGPYIVTQGPFITSEVDTVADFWLMAFENGADITCVTDRMGYNHNLEVIEKCYPYWEGPYEKDSLKVIPLEGPETVIAANAIGQKVTKRLFSIAYGEETKIVTFWHCEKWEDYKGYDPKILAQLFKMQLTQPKTMITNCSAGIGRSGAPEGRIGAASIGGGNQY